MNIHELYWVFQYITLNFEDVSFFVELRVMRVNSVLTPSDIYKRLTKSEIYEARSDSYCTIKALEQVK